VLEAQETRGLTRSDDISRLLPSEAANMARGRRVRQSKLLFFAKVWAAGCFLRFVQSSLSPMGSWRFSASSVLCFGHVCCSPLAKVGVGCLSCVCSLLAISGSFSFEMFCKLHCFVLVVL
jgi:hypothetical protein